MKSHQIALLCHAGQVQIVIDDKFHADFYIFLQLCAWQTHKKLRVDISVMQQKLLRVKHEGQRKRIKTS